MRKKVIAIFSILMGLGTIFGMTASAMAGESPAENSTHEKLLFVGMAGIWPNDINVENPELAQLLQNYSFAALTPRSVDVLTCPSEGWLQLRTSRDVSDRVSNLAQDPEREPMPYDDDCHPATLQEAAVVHSTTNPTLVHIRDFTQRLGETYWPAEPLFAPNTVAIGENAGIPLADTDGTVRLWESLPDSGLGTDTIQAQRNLTAMLNDAPSDVVADIGSIRGTPQQFDVETQKSQINQRLIDILTANANSDHPRRVIIASLGDQWRRAHLHFFATDIPLAGNDQATAPAQPATISSERTRAYGFMTIADVRNLITGKTSGLAVTPAPSVVAALTPAVDVAKQAYTAASSSSMWYRYFNIIVGVGIVATLLLFLIKPAPAGREWGVDNRYWKAIENFNLWAFAWVPAALLLNFVPWWKLPGSPGVMQAWTIGFTALIALALTVIAHFTPHRAGLIAMVAFAVLSLDIIAGSPHQRNGFMGSLILTSRRYYGISNRTYLILVVCGLVAALLIIEWLRRRARSASVQSATKHRHLSKWWNDADRRAAGVFGMIGLIALLVDALPNWGADFGGPPGIIAGFAIAAWWISGSKFRWWYVLLWLVTSAAAMFLAGFLDVHRGSESHIGRFWDSFGTPESWAIIGGKIRDVTRSFVSRPDLIFLMVGAIVLALVVVIATKFLDRQSRAHFKAARKITGGYGVIPAIVGIAVGILVAVPINDSGALMIKEGLYISLPAIAAMIAGRAGDRKSIKIAYRDRIRKMQRGRLHSRHHQRVR